MAARPRISPLPSNAPLFAYEFAKLMRLRRDATKRPSVRQIQSIAQLLSARYFRNGRLTLEDFLDAAVYTTFPPDQTIAREVAEDILLGRENDVKLPETSEKLDSVVKTETDALSKVMDQIRREQELAKIIKKEKVEAGYEYLRKLRKKRDRRLYDAVRDYLTDGEIVLRGITSDKELKEAASHQLMERFGGLSTKDIQNSKFLNCMDEVCDSPNSAEQIAASALRGDQDIEQRFSMLAERDPSTGARALRHMEELESLLAEQLKSVDQILQDALNNLGEAADYARELGRIPDTLEEFIVKAPQQFSLSDTAAFAQKIKDATGKDIMENLLEEYDRQFDFGASNRLNMLQLAENARENISWQSLVKKMTIALLHGADSRSSPSDYLRSSLAQNQVHEQHFTSPITKKQWREAMNELANGAIERSLTKQHLRQAVQYVSRLGYDPSAETIRKAGKNLGMTEEEILELINPSFEVIMNLIQAGLADFERLQNLMSSTGLSRQQLRQLGDLAAQKGNQSALGAVAHVDFHAALGTQGSGTTRRGYGYQFSTSAALGIPYDKDRANMAFGGLLSGPATNIIKIWYTYRDELPLELKQRLHDIAKRLLIDLGKRYARQTMGSSMLGGLQESTTVRPFRIGDDTDLIDLEETIDFLLSQGRTNFTLIETSDFLVTDTYKGHRAFFWALDKSGSMDTPKKLGMLALSVMAGLYGIQKDDFGVVLFDSVTHVVKEIANRNISVDKIASNLLDVKAGGGTGGHESMRHALRNFEDTRAKEKIFVFSTDMYLSDQQACEVLAERMKPLGIKMIVLVPTHEHNKEAASSLAKKANGVILDINSVDELPAKLLRVTNY